MTKPQIDIATVRALVPAEIFSRGRAYVRSGAVRSLTRRGDVISADVEGSEAAPYRVAIRLSETGIADASCTCPYEWGGYCKHVAAALICLVERPGEVRTRKPIDEILSAVDKTTLVALIARRIASDDDFALWLEAEPELAPTIAPRKGAKRQSLVDQAPIKDYAHALTRGRYRQRRHWDDFETSGSAEELQRLVQKATPFLERGDGRNALRVLEAVTDTFVDAWLSDGHAADEDMYLLFDDLARLIAEAALIGDLAPEERDALAETIENWHERLSDYGAGDEFPIAIRALETGWDDPLLLKVLEGKARTWPPEKRADSAEATLTTVRLRVLKACERFEEYLNLSRASGAHAQHAGMVAQLGRVEEALAYARKTFKTPSEAHDFAKGLRVLAQDDAAMAMAEFGLAMPRPSRSTARADVFGADRGRTVLAHWLRDYAGAMGKAQLALQAAMLAFSLTHSSEDFRAAERWSKAKGAGKTWASARKLMLDDLQAADYAYERVAIFLAEGMIAEAIEAAGENGAQAGGAETLMHLAAAAAPSHPAWVIGVALSCAGAIMNEGRSGHYAEAARWLEAASHAYVAAGRDDEWRGLIESLIETHRRKHKLRPLLEHLR